LLEERRKLEEEADKMSVFATSFSASTLRGLGTTYGKAMMIVGELALCGRVGRPGAEVVLHFESGPTSGRAEGAQEKRESGG